MANQTALADARRCAQTVLVQAEQILGANPVLDEEKRALGMECLNPTGCASASETAWQHYALARAYLRAGYADLAARESSQAIAIDPHGMWPNFYHGLCTFRAGRFPEAAAAFSVCIGAAPDAAGCYCNRALSFTAMKLTDSALRDYDCALRLDPTSTTATLNRGRLHFQSGRYADAAADFARARELGADRNQAAKEFAVMHAARGEYWAALSDVFHFIARNRQFDNSAPGSGDCSR